MTSDRAGQGREIPGTPMSPAPYADAYDADYYAHNCGERPYRRDAEWLAFFQAVADRIVEGIGPRTVLDAGCAMGFLVETLRGRGVEAWGVDISDYAIAQAHPSVLPFVQVGSITTPFGRRYDLITCIEVLEHMPPAEAPAAIANLCAHADDILFSSSPLDRRELTHLNVQPPEYWTEIFAQHGFYRDVDFDASVLTAWAVRFRRGVADKPDPRPLFARVAAAYERRLWHLVEENGARRDVALELRDGLMRRDLEIEGLRRRLEGMEADRVDLEVRLHALAQANANLGHQVDSWRARWYVLEASPGWAVLQRLQHARARFLPPGSRGERALFTAIRWKHLIQARGPVFFAGHLLRESRATAAYRLREWRRRRHPDRIERLAVPAIPHLAPVPDHAEAVDIVVCVHNALIDVQRCLASVSRHTPPPFRLILVDDGSDAETAAWLRDFADRRPDTLLLRSEAAGGYTRAANRGLARVLASAGTAEDPRADFVVLLNSDTMVTPGWLDRLVACARSDARIGLAGPLSNAATWQSIPELESPPEVEPGSEQDGAPGGAQDGRSAGQWAVNALPEGLSVDDFAELVARDSGRLYPRLPFLNGFCLLVRRAVLEQVGLFDEDAFGAGYGEENDYALRARAAGWQLALADDAYVYHAGSQSYSEHRRRALVPRADQALVHKHGAEIIAAGVTALRADPLLLGIRARARVLAERDRIVRGGRDRFAGKRVLVVLPVAAAGGGASIAMFEMRAMRDMGAEVALFNLAAHRTDFEAAYPELDLPVIFGQPQDLVVIARDWDAVVATAYSSVEWLALAARGPQGAGTVFGYFIQDLEAYFYPPGSERFHAALRSYTLMPGLRCFTMTPWNADELERLLGVASTPVMPGYDAALFRPRPLPGSTWPARPLVIAAMIRPATPFRSPRLTMQVLGEIARRHGPKVEFHLFGVEPHDAGWDDLPRDFPFKLAGRIGPRQMPTLLGGADIFVDFSTWQAMGMTAMEAMAMGTAVVITRHGGPGVFARDGENCLLVDAHDAEACLAALERLVVDEDLRRRLQVQGIQDICHFYPERAAFNMLNSLFGPEIDAANRAAAERAAAAGGAARHEAALAEPVLQASTASEAIGS